MKNFLNMQKPFTKKKCLKAVNFKKWDKDVGWHVADKEIQMDK